MAITTPFREEHLNAMRVKESARDITARPEMRGALARLSSMNLGITILSDNGVILGVMGAVPTIPGVCEVFIVATEDQSNHAVAFARCTRSHLYTLKEKYRRIQAVAKDDGFHARWLGWLGFTKEGVLRKYGLDGEDMAMWGLV